MERRRDSVKKKYTEPVAVVIAVDVTVDTIDTSGTDDNNWGGFHPIG